MGTGTVIGGRNGVGALLVPLAPGTSGLRPARLVASVARWRAWAGLGEAPASTRLAVARRGEGGEAVASTEEGAWSCAVSCRAQCCNRHG